MHRGTISAIGNEILDLRLYPLHRTRQTISNLNGIREHVTEHLAHIEASDLSDRASQQEQQSVANMLEAIRNNTESVFDNPSIAREQFGHHEQGTARDEYFAEQEEDADQVRRRTANTSSTAYGRRLGTLFYYAMPRSHPTRTTTPNILVAITVTTRPPKKIIMITNTSQDAWKSRLFSVPVETKYGH